jgi:CheY-like chemotaxis protein/HPt (histidine-containing phosphotransfer) domain-containing protein
MSHEIRTPLNAIIGMVELLLASSLTRGLEEDLKVVHSAAYALLSVINDILDFSKIEAGKLELERSPFNLRDFLGEALKILAVKAHEKNLELAYRVAPDVPDRLVGDPHRFRQVLLNLIGNALKFTESGEIVVFAQRKSLEANRLVLHVAVKDTGVGIAAGKQALIFDAFKQADGSTSRKYGGTGLGLAVSAQLVNLMGGRIGVKSVLGKGSIFHFTIAFEVESAGADAAQLPDAHHTRGLRILVIDDNDTNSKILCEMLASWKMVPRPAASAADGLALMASEKRRGTPIDMILVDSDLPQTGALWLIEQVKKMDADSARVIVMLTTTAIKATAQFHQAGACAAVIKPIRPSDLLDAVLQALSGKSSPVEKPRVTTALGMDSPLPPLSVLVAEDTPFNQKYIRRLLESWCFSACIVANGRQAIDALAERDFDLVLMDVQMPEMDGLTATSRIRELEKQTGRHVPIIAMTAHAMRGDRERCLDAGMDDYVRKPISPPALLETIHRVVPVNETNPATAGAADPPTPMDPQAELEALLDAFNNDVNLFEDVADMFIGDYPSMVVRIRDAIAVKDSAALGRTAHALKGMALNFQIDTVADTAMQLERLAERGRFDEASDLSRRLSDELTAFERRLRQIVARIQSD